MAPQKIFTDEMNECVSDVNASGNYIFVDAAIRCV